MTPIKIEDSVSNLPVLLYIELTSYLTRDTIIDCHFITLYLQLLHGEQYVEVLSPVGESIPTNANLRTTSTVDAVLDKGKGRE